ncbi:glycosyltransferase [bacterium SCSIO 12741]|nr:glycosyltransferase [bacterium SCSIO 12741]
MRKSAVDRSTLPQEIEDSVSVIIPARNEEQNLPELLQRLCDQSLSKSQYEVVVIDDQSDDSTAEIVEQFALKNPELKLQLIRQTEFSESPKKEALEKGIKNSQGSLILQTDADCLPGPEWIKTVAQLFSVNSFEMLLLPVYAEHDGSLVARYDQYETAAFQCITFGTAGWQDPQLANGANLAYRKEAFNEVYGFDGAKKSYSGDDISLLQKFKQSGKKIQSVLLAEVITETETVRSWKELFAQRVRWGGKNKRIASPLYWLLTGFLVALQIYLLSLLIFNPYTWLGAFIIKLILDSWMLDRWHSLGGKKADLSYFPLISLIYPFVLTFLFIASLLYAPKWKGRRIKV